MTKLKKVSLGMGGTLVAFVVVGGLMHTPPGLRLLARLGVVCPALAVTPATVADLRAEGLKMLRGARPAPVRYAAGLELGASDEAAVRSWAAGRGAVCARKTRGLVLLTCARPFHEGPFHEGPLHEGPLHERSEEAVVALDMRGRVLSVDITNEISVGSDAARRFRERRDHLAATFGAASEEGGDVDAVARAGTGFETAVVRYRFSDYLALLQAVRLPSGLYVREQYQSAL